MPKRILYCVLDWGLGHATRSIPIIGALLERGYEVVLASDSLALDFLCSEYPSLRSYKLPSYGVKYKSENLILNGINNLKSIRSAIKAEHGMIRMIAVKEKIDAIISDNRYGCHVPGIPAVMVTHQLQFRTGNVIQDRLGRMMIKKLLKPFRKIWVPDDEAHSLSGVLSMSNDPRVMCIGWQSTLISGNGVHDVYPADDKARHDIQAEQSQGNAHGGNHINGDEEIAVAAILSGPEPMRTTLEAEIRKQFEALDMKCALVRGVKGRDQVQKEGNITIYDVLNRHGINRLMNSASIIICRSGYSSLMDLQAIGKKAILIPTPGQPEQKYLADRMKLFPQYSVQKQGELNIQLAIHQLENIKSPMSDAADSELLGNAITELFTLDAVT